MHGPRGAPALPRLARRGVEGDDKVAQHAHGAAVPAVALHGEGQHVRGLRSAAPLPVQLRDVRVAAQHDGQLREPCAAAMGSASAGLHTERQHLVYCLDERCWTSRLALSRVALRGEHACCNWGYQSWQLGHLHPHPHATPRAWIRIAEPP